MDNTERLVKVEENTKSAHKRIDRIENLLETNNKLVTNVEIIATEMKAMREDVNKMDSRLNAIEDKPAKNWENLIKIILTRNCNSSFGLFFSKVRIIERR